MDSGAYGFFLGAAPGLSYIVGNMIQLQRVTAKAQEIARQNGELLDVHFSPSLRVDYLFRPGSFIRPDDGAGLRNAKELLLSVRRKMLIRHALGALMTVIGALIGVVIAIAIGSVV
ncbi:hypothetical protein EC912_106141 [Luteibacter rhizovicinus]|uniref:Uncharacterized protein n=1 Tax=Luteibacter rhizovicinus TaxID=242606 RepID=A0A4R3YKX8_9GAMM|nr:hypothetical protein [Luteibacter rhizovicinus]TCV92802.1 hypothetical protein EC912_106141 [Luteibacter rhizovicinus]